jgi:hypothetical protein
LKRVAGASRATHMYHVSQFTFTISA